MPKVVGAVGPRDPPAGRTRRRLLGALQRWLAADARIAAACEKVLYRIEFIVPENLRGSVPMHQPVEKIGIMSVSKHLTVPHFPYRALPEQERSLTE